MQEQDTPKFLDTVAPGDWWFENEARPVGETDRKMTKLISRNYPEE